MIGLLPIFLDSLRFSSQRPSAPLEWHSWAIFGFLETVIVERDSPLDLATVVDQALQCFWITLIGFGFALGSVLVGLGVWSTIILTRHAHANDSTRRDSPTRYSTGVWATLTLIQSNYIQHFIGTSRCPCYANTWAITFTITIRDFTFSGDRRLVVIITYNLVASLLVPSISSLISRDLDWSTGWSGGNGCFN